MMVRRSNLLFNCEMKMCAPMTLALSMASTSFRMSSTHSYCHWLLVVHRNSTWGRGQQALILFYSLCYQGSRDTIGAQIKSPVLNTPIRGKQKLALVMWYFRSVKIWISMLIYVNLSPPLLLPVACLPLSQNRRRKLLICPLSISFFLYYVWFQRRELKTVKGIKEGEGSHFFPLSISFFL